MLLNRYEQDGRLLNINFIEKASAEVSGYRGELVLIPGEVGDSAGRRKPPVSVVEQVVMLADANKIKMISGLLHDLSELEPFFTDFAADLDADTTPLFFVVNASKEMKITRNGVTADIIPLPEGLVWSELCDLLNLEKSAFKGQSSGEKIVTVYDELKSYCSGFSEMAWADALNSTTSAKRETRGAL